jgi:uncharacterized protein involved in exopolysaccharide biosynthesis
MKIDFGVRQILEILIERLRFIIVVVVAIGALGGGILAMIGTSYQAKATILVKFGLEMPTDVVRPLEQRNGAGPNDQAEEIRSFAELLKGPALSTALLMQMDVARVYPQLAGDPHAVEKAQRILKRNLKIGIPERTHLITLSLNHPDPEIAAEMVNRLIALFIRSQASPANDAQVEFLQQNVAEVHTRLAASQDALAAFVKANAGVTAINENVITLFAERARIVAQLAETKASSAGAAARAESLGKALSHVPDSIASTDAELYHGTDSVSDHLTELELQRAQLLTTHQPDSRPVKQVDDLIAKARMELAVRQEELGRRNGKVPSQLYQNLSGARLTAEADHHAAAIPIAVFQSQLQNLDVQISTLEALKTRHAELARQIDLDEEHYKFLVQRLEESRLAAGMDAQGLTRFAKVEPATVPTSPSGPPLPLVAVAIAAIALIAGAGAALALAALDNRLRTAGQVAFALGMPVLAVMPEFAKPHAGQQ